MSGERDALEGALDEASRRASRSRWISVAGVAAAIVIALCVNLLASRHYRRWDATETGLYTLSRVTEHTLKGLDETVEVYVLLSSGDPLVLTLRHVLDAYRAISPRIQPRFVDPDQSPAEFLAIQQKYGVNAAKTEGGRVVTDAGTTTPERTPASPPEQVAGLAERRSKRSAVVRLASAPLLDVDDEPLSP